MTNQESILVLQVADENASCDDCLYYNQMEDCPKDEECIVRQAIYKAIKALSKRNKAKRYKRMYVGLKTELANTAKIEYKRGYEQAKWDILRQLENMRGGEYASEVIVSILEIQRIIERMGYKE